MTETAQAPPVEWALAYAAEGFAVLPVWWRVADGEGWRCACSKGAACDRPAKHPIPSQGVKQATTDQDRILAWWGEHPEANVAMATGSISGVIIIDVDTGNGKEGDIAITTACADKGGVPPTLRAQSGSGGLHYAYTYRTNPYTRKIGFLKHVDYLADGGYVIVQPSCNTKGAYTWQCKPAIAKPKDIKRLRAEMQELPAWFDALEGSGRSGRKGDRKTRNEATMRARIVNAAAMEFRASDPKWVEQVQLALACCDPDSRDDWVLFGIILGREFERNEDGWRLYNEWASRSAKFADAGTPKAMRGYYYDESNCMPQGGEPATIATIFSRARDGGWTLPAGGLDRRPVVAYRAGRAIETVNTVLTLLARERESESDAPLRVYAFGSGLGSVIETHDYGAMYNKDGTPPNGWIMRVSAYNSMALGSRVTHTATVVKFSATGSTLQVECPTEVSSLLLSDYSKHFPRLNGIVQWPMVIDRRIIGSEEPYDPKAGLLFSLPEKLDLSDIGGGKAEAQKSWEWIKTVALADFPFGGDRDWAAALALLLTFVQRRMMDSAPAFLITAPIQGTGKTSLVKFASRVVHGRTIGASSLSMVAEEQRKAITAALLTNPPALLFDNLQAGSSFDSKELAVAMTSGEWEDRRLGSTERLTLPNRAVWTFTGNNVSLSNDLRRRFVVIRLVPQSRAHFEQRFSRNLDTWAVEHRQEVLRALLTILSWGAKSSTDLNTESGFPVWDREVRRVVVALTGFDPFKLLSEQSEEDHDDDLEEAIGMLTKAWAMFINVEPATVRDFIDLVHDAVKSANPTRRKTAESVDTAVAIIRSKPEQHLDALDYGRALKMMEDRPLLVSGEDVHFECKGRKGGSVTWRLIGAESIVEKIDKDF